MKTKQQFLSAKLGEPKQNAKNLNGSKELVSRILVIDKKSERVIVDARCWMSSSPNASRVYSSVWVHSPEFQTSGHGSAGGLGYHKESAALQRAISSAGIELYGDVYGRERVKKRAYIYGVGDGAMQSACLAIAYAVGCKDAVIVN